MLKIDELTKSFGSKIQVTSSQWNHFRGQTRRIIALMGCLAGKIYTLNIIGGLLSGDGGEITSMGVGRKALQGGRCWANWLADIPRFSLIEQSVDVDNVAVALELSGVNAKDAERRR